MTPINPDLSSETAAETVLRVKVLELECLREAAMALVYEHCREELGAPTWKKCNRPAEFVLWGKLIPAEGLGPRCYDHAAEHVGHDALAPASNYALMDLRPVRRAAGLEER